MRISFAALPTMALPITSRTPSDRESIAARADDHDHIVAALMRRSNAGNGIEGEAPFLHTVDPCVPQGDFRGRVRRDGNVEHEPFPLESPRAGEQPVQSFEG